MALTLHLSDPTGGMVGAAAPLTLERGKATIGRGSQNDLVLPDPQRVISKQHCVIECLEGRYRVTDTSTNGVFLNRNEEPIGRGKHAFLKNGDHLRISHYELQAEVTETIPVPQSAPSDRGRSPLSDTHDDGSERREDLDRMIGLGDHPGAGTSGPVAQGGREIIPDDSGIWAPAAPKEAPVASGQHISPEREYFQAPKSFEAIPEDWEAEAASDAPVEPPLAEAPAPSPPQPERQAADLFTDTIEPEAPVSPPATPPASAPAPEPPPNGGAPRAAPAIAAESRAFLDAFLDGAELSDLQLTDEQAAEVMYLLGQMYREVVTGLMELLATRGSIKNEFRLSQTTIQPAQNNPLKFSLGADDAMAALLTRRGRTYLPPVEAIREAVGDVKAHQVAVLAGMQLALNGLLRRFDPASLEERMQSDRSLTSILGGQKARYWDAFKQMYKDLIVEAEDDFHNLFGKEFNRAYEDQIRKLTKR